MHFLLTYFHQVKGPIVFLSYPQDVPKSIENKTLRFFDLDIDETFFEIILIKKNLRIINNYFEVQSDWARGGIEMVMLSLSMKNEYDSKLVYGFLEETSQRIITTDNIYKSFYKNDDFHDNDIEIDLNYEILKKILRDYLDILIKKLKNHTF